MTADEDAKLKFVYREARKFLQERVDEDSLKLQLEHYREYKASSITDLFRRMIATLKNKQGYVNFIADINQMGEILSDFNPTVVYKNYGDDWHSLFEEFEREFGHNYKMDISNPRNAWVMYSKGVISCAKFLSNFKSTADFENFVNTFSYNEFTTAALPMLLEKEIFGYGFALSCDFLKEVGYVKYGKPDTHLKDIFVGVGITKSSDDYEVFKTIVKMGTVVGEEPVIIDKLFWLIGSGKIEIKRNFNIGRNKKEFINLVNQKWSKIENVAGDLSRIL